MSLPYTAIMGQGRRILVVDDEVHVQRLLRMYLQQAGYEVQTCGDGPTALAAVRQFRPDLMVLDLMLPGMGGIEVCRLVRQQRDIPIIMLTARSTEQDRLQGLRDGADDYVTKPFSPPEVVLRVEAVLRRVQPGTDDAARVLEVGPVRLDPDLRLVTISGDEVALTPTEFRLLETFLGSPGRTFTRQQLLDHIASPDFGGFDRNVDVHVANLRRKLGLQPSPIHTVYGVGYRYQAGNS